MPERERSTDADVTAATKEGRGKVYPSARRWVIAQGYGAVWTLLATAERVGLRNTLASLSRGERDARELPRAEADLARASKRVAALRASVESIVKAHAALDAMRASLERGRVILDARRRP